MIDNHVRPSFLKITEKVMEGMIEIIGLILAVAGLFFTAFYAFFGKPKISAEYHSAPPEDSYTGLYLVLRNHPVKNKFLSKMGVLRTSVRIKGRYSIKNSCGEELESGTQWIRLNHEEAKTIVTLNDHEWAVLPCALSNRHDDYFHAGHEEHSESKRFRTGTYIYFVEIDSIGKKFSREFIFSKSGLEWNAVTNRGRI